MNIGELVLGAAITVALKHIFDDVVIPMFKSMLIKTRKDAIEYGHYFNKRMKRGHKQALGVCTDGDCADNM